jgi:hypothetical protein
VATARKLPVFDTAGAAYVFVWSERGTVLRLSWFPLLVGTIAGFFATQTATVIATKFLAIAAWAVIAPALHRVILFGDRQPGTLLNLRFGKVEALFALVPFLYAVVIIGLQLLGVPLKWHVNGGPALVMFCVMAVVIFFLGRFSLVFPIAVVERRLDFALASGNVWRMIAVWVLVTTPAFMVLGALQSVLLGVLKFTPWAMTAEQLDGSLLELAVLSYPMSIVFGALCVGILSYSYKALAGFAPDFELKPKV